MTEKRERNTETREKRPSDTTKQGETRNHRDRTQRQPDRHAEIERNQKRELTNYNKS